MSVAPRTDPRVDAYIAGARLWPAELAALRPILLGAGLHEVLKWGKPCYTHAGRNVVILQEMRAHLALMFFAGALLPDPDGVLEAQGPHSRLARRICVTSPAEAARLAPTVRAYAQEAMRLAERPADAGAAVPAASPPPEVPVAELEERLRRDPALRAAFAALTPGRQREYRLYIAAAKRPATRAARVERCVPGILAGRGLRDR